jgi:nicotinate-nucleotide adenylyltransferase
MQIGLFFGSFNPVHIGHMVIANHMISHTDLDKLWMVVSPHNPHKKKKSLANNYDRLNLLTKAIGDNTQISASDIEFSLPTPSYTIDTLTYLKEKYPNYTFSLIMGGDNLYSFHKWKNYELLLESHQILVYQRPTHELPEIASHPNIHILDAPMMNISSSYIRSEIEAKRSIRYLVPDSIHDNVLSIRAYTHPDGQ